MNIIYDQKGRVIPEQRIIVYRELLQEVKDYKRRKEIAFMCNLFNLMYIKKISSFRLNISFGNIYKSQLPELRAQRPKVAPSKVEWTTSSAWYDGYEYDKRIEALERAIELWEKKYGQN